MVLAVFFPPRITGAKAGKHTRHIYVYVFAFPGALTAWFDVEAD